MDGWMDGYLPLLLSRIELDSFISLFTNTASLQVHSILQHNYKSSILFWYDARSLRNSFSSVIKDEKRKK